MVHGWEIATLILAQHVGEVLARLLPILSITAIMVRDFISILASQMDGAAASARCAKVEAVVKGQRVIMITATVARGA